MTVATEARPISLGLDCTDFCDDLAAPLLRQLSVGYEVCSVLHMPASVDAWMAEHRTARKRVWRCERRGYTFGDLRRELHADEIFEINTSMPRRQGRPMSASYQERHDYSPLPDYLCAFHRVRTFGVWSPTGVLVAYLTTYRCGDLVLVSQILGHADHLEAEVMWLLFAGMLGREASLGGLVVYNRHDSGTEGLRWFKERLGFREETVEWRP